MAGGQFLARRREQLLARGQAQRGRLRQQLAALDQVASRLDQTLESVGHYAKPPVLAAVGAVTVIALGRQRALRLALGALGAWTAFQRARRLGAGLGLLGRPDS